MIATRLERMHALLESVVREGRGLLPNEDLIPRKDWSIGQRQAEDLFRDSLYQADKLVANHDEGEP